MWAPFSLPWRDDSPRARNWLGLSVLLKHPSPSPCPCGTPHYKNIRMWQTLTLTLFLLTNPPDIVHIYMWPSCAWMTRDKDLPNYYTLISVSVQSIHQPSFQLIWWLRGHCRSQTGSQLQEGPRFIRWQYWEFIQSSARIHWNDSKRETRSTRAAHVTVNDCEVRLHDWIILDKFIQLFSGSLVGKARTSVHFPFATRELREFLIL